MVWILNDSPGLIPTVPGVYKFFGNGRALTIQYEFFAVSVPGCDVRQDALNGAGDIQNFLRRLR